MGLVYLDLLIVQIVFGKINCAGLFLDHPCRVTQQRYCSRSVWIVFIHYLSQLRGHKDVGDTKLGILRPQFSNPDALWGG